MTPAQKNLTTPIVIIVGMMTWALYPHNRYGYYVLLRLISFVLFIVLHLFTIAMIKDKRPTDLPADFIGWPGLFVLLAIIYNPVVQIHLTREIWSFINIATIILLTAFWYLRVRVFEGTLVFSKKILETPLPVLGQVPKVTDLEDCKALTNDAIKCFDSKRYGDCAWVLDKIIGKYGKNNDPLIIKMVAQAHFFKAESLIFLNRKEEGIKLYLDLIEQFHNSKNSTIMNLVNSAKEQISKIQPNN